MAPLPYVRLGPYELLAALGAGGMGEVYTALDTKLGRKVAIKILPERLAQDPAALARFEREAKVLAALNHPAILTIFDCGRDGDIAFVVTELLEGRPLREVIRGGPMVPQRAVALGVQVARGLAAAHEKGVVHRDIKPENLFLTRDGMKILDFGLARTEPGGHPQNRETRGLDSGLTGEGVLLGTIGYMSPEQVRGQTADARSDIFALGVVLFELLAGRAPFRGGSEVETLNAILKEDPPAWGDAASMAPALDRIVRHCLEKEPEKRFQSAMDLAFDLENLETASVGAAPPGLGARWPSLSLMGVALLVVGVGLGSLTGWIHPAAPPVFHRLTHERGTVSSGRFIPGSPEVLFSAQWVGRPSAWYSQRLDQPGMHEVPGGGGVLLNVSKNGEAMGLADVFLMHGMPSGRLFSLPIQGGARRERLDLAWAAEPEGASEQFAVVVGDYMHQINLEWPQGKVLRSTSLSFKGLRIRGDRLATFQEVGDDIERGSLLVFDRQGRVTTQAALRGFSGLAWGPDGKEVWVSVFQDGQSKLLAVDLKGRIRPLLHHAGRLELLDVDPAGRVLAALHAYQRQTLGRGPGEVQDRDLGWLEAQSTIGLAADGSRVMLGVLGEWNAVDGPLYLRPFRGGPPQNMGQAVGQPTLSQDGAWIATKTMDSDASLRLIPTGSGSTRTFPLPGFEKSSVAPYLLADHGTLVFHGRIGTEPSRFFSLNTTTGAFQPLSPPNCIHYSGQEIRSPDGRWLAFIHSDGSSGGSNLPMAIMRTDGSGFHHGPPLRRGESVSGWTADSKALFVYNRNELPLHLERLELATGKRTPLISVNPPDPGGVAGIPFLFVTPDQRTYAYNLTRKLSELYVIEGLK